MTEAGGLAFGVTDEDPTMDPVVMAVSPEAGPTFTVTGIGGLRTLLDMVQRSWAGGTTVTIHEMTVVFEPKDGKPEPFRFEVLPAKRGTKP